MKNALLVAIIALAFALPAYADTAIYRIDSKAGTTAATYAVLTPQLELWAYAAQTKDADLETGRLYQIPSPKKTLVLAGGYYAYWADGRKSFAEPYLVLGVTVGRVKLAADGGSYLPLNGGPTVHYVNEASAMAPLDRKVQVGLAASLWYQDGVTTTRIGLKASANLGGGVSLTTRYLVGTSGAPDTLIVMVSW